MTNKNYSLKDIITKIEDNLQLDKNLILKKLLLNKVLLKKFNYLI